PARLRATKPPAPLLQPPDRKHASRPAGCRPGAPPKTLAEARCQPGPESFRCLRAERNRPTHASARPPHLTVETLLRALPAGCYLPRKSPRPPLARQAAAAISPGIPP